MHPQLDSYGLREMSVCSYSTLASHRFYAVTFILIYEAWETTRKSIYDKCITVLLCYWTKCFLAATVKGYLLFPLSEISSVTRCFFHLTKATFLFFALEENKHLLCWLPTCFVETHENWRKKKNVDSTCLCNCSSTNRIFQLMPLWILPKNLRRE